MTEIIPTRGAALALAEERQLIETGYEFLDEKRMLLTSNLLRELDALRGITAEYHQKMEVAVQALKRAVVRHGLEGIQLYPAKLADTQEFELKMTNFLGLRLAVEPEFMWRVTSPQPAVDASEKAEECRAAFAALLPLAARLAARLSNINKLIEEYRNTERRARALENVLLPETKSRLTAITGHLDEADQKEAIRIKNAAG